MKPNNPTFTIVCLILIGAVAVALTSCAGTPFKITYSGDTANIGYSSKSEVVIDYKSGK